MTHGQLVNQDGDSQSVARMKEFFDRGLFPAEKKPFLIDLRKSAGPLMAVDGGTYILDVASQIASLGLGFNPGVMFGATQFVESWSGQTETPAIGHVKRALHELFQRLLDWNELHVQLCNSGAEAIETALGLCFRKRVHSDAKKVIAFEGSFHGRMMVALASTYNPAKREPFAWDGFETSYVPYPEMKKGDDVAAPPIPNGWQEAWMQGPRSDFESSIRQRFAGDDELLDREVDSLLRLRALLVTGEHYAVIVEPMQCEGGDRYSSSRFHHGLINLVRSFNTSLVYDEIQTGFGLGGDFFWHSKFGLQDACGNSLFPDHVVLAKKAQVGGVISRESCDFVEQYNAASLVRGFIHASMMDQFRAEIDRLEQRSRQELESLMQEFPGKISRPRACGLSFAFDFDNPDDLKRFVGRRFHHGLLYYPAGQHAARFRFNLSFRGDLAKVAWQQIGAALRDTLAPGNAGESVVSVQAPNVESYFSFHQRFISGKLARLRDQENVFSDLSSFFDEALNAVGIQPNTVDVVEMDESNWSDYRSQVADLQCEIYEPLRQTPMKKFDQLIAAPHGIALAVLKAGRIIAMAFAAPPVNFPEERGVRGDEHFDDPATIYMLDLTVIPEFRGQLGRIMKQAVCLAAQSRGLDAVQGRNRDRLARGMWAINLALGSYCTRVLKDDYLDEHEHRDCLMYRCELGWSEGPLNMSTGVEQPLTVTGLTEEFCNRNLASVVNKLTLSNFVTHQYLQDLDRVFDILPEALRQGYTASGPSECVDKLVKAFWLKRKPRRRLVTIADSFYGHGSFLARSLSGDCDPLFESTQLSPQDVAAAGSLAGAVERETANDDVLAVFVEPLGWRNGRRIPQEELLAISEACRKTGTPLITHDSAGMFHRHSKDVFLPAAIDGFDVDGGMVFLGGQMAVCFMREDYFDDTPLMFISTWDGDVFSLSRFVESLEQLKTMDMPALRERYHELLTGMLVENGVAEYSLAGGAGWFQGPIQSDLAKMFHRCKGNRYVSCPSPGAMQRFVANFEDQKSQ